MRLHCRLSSGKLLPPVLTAKTGNTMLQHSDAFCKQMAVWGPGLAY